MPTVNKTFTFTSDTEGWTFTSGGKGANAAVAGNLATDSIGRNNNDTSFWEWVGTWEALGVPVNSTVTEVGSGTDNDYDYNVTNANVVDSCGTGPFALYDNTPTLQGTFSNVTAGITTNVAWTTTSGSPISVPVGIQASSSTIRLRITHTIDLGNNIAARATVGLDNVNITITYDATVEQSVTESVSFISWIDDD